MAETLKDAGVTPLGTGWTLVYEVPAATIFVVGMLHLDETTGVLRACRLCVVPPGDMPAVGNSVLWDYTIEANGARRLLQGDNWEAGTKLYGMTTPDGAVNVRLSGIEQT